MGTPPVLAMCFATFYHTLFASKLYDLVAPHLSKCLTHSCPCQTGTEVLMCRAKWLFFYLLLTTFYLLLITYNIALSTLISTPTENIRLKIMHEFHEYFNSFTLSFHFFHCVTQNCVSISQIFFWPTNSQLLHLTCQFKTNSFYILFCLAFCNSK